MKLALAAAAVVVVAIVAANLLPSSAPVDLSGPSPALAPSRSPQARQSTVPAVVDPGRDYVVLGRNSLSVDGIPFSIEILAGWSEYGNYITKSTVGAQGAEALIYWTSYPGGPTAEQCAYLRSRSVEPSAAGLAAAVSEVPGTDLVTGPTDVTLGGLTAKHVVFHVRDDVGCDPGFFFTYPNVYGGALWPETVPGDTIRVWIVEVGRSVLFVVGGTQADAGPRLEDELLQIVDSIKFD